jgi:hypothetical protein
MAISLESEGSSNEASFVTTIGAAFANLASENVRGILTSDELAAANISSTGTPAGKSTLKWGELITGTVQTDTYTVSGGVTYINWNDGTGSQTDTANFPAPVLGSFDVNHTTLTTVTTVKPYRNSLFGGNCLVNFWYLGVGQVHTEAFIHNLYRYSDAIASEAPSVSTTVTTKTDLTVTPRAIATLKTRWYVDGAIQTTTANSLAVDPCTLSTGNHTVRAEVYDMTTVVRTSYLADLVSSRQWTVTVAGTTPSTPSTPSQSGGGGGAPSHWFLAALAVLAVVKAKQNKKASTTARVETANRLPVERPGVSKDLPGHNRFNDSITTNAKF